MNELQVLESGRDLCLTGSVRVNSPSMAPDFAFSLAWNLSVCPVLDMKSYRPSPLSTCGK